MEIIENLDLPDWIHLIVITDGFYGAKKNFAFKLLGKGIDIVSRLRVDAAIYEPPPEKKTKTKKRGRPRKYGDRLYIKQLAESKNFLTPTEITIYSKKKIVDLGSKIVKIRGWDKLVLLVITKDANNKTIALFSTNILLSPARVLQLYSARWKIELAFRELKQLGKMADYRIRSKEGMTKHVTLCFVAHSLLRLLPLTKIQMHVQPVRRPWYKKAGITTGQLRIMFQRECLLQLFFSLLQQLGITHENDTVINEFNSLINRANEVHYERNREMKSF